MSKTFQTLMLREWLQHGRGWLLVALVPPALALLMLLLPFGTVQLDEPLEPTELALMSLTITAYLVLMISWSIAALQLPGLARRDQQDRSIEFWLSLPASHVQSLGAQLSMHLLLVPMGALLIGALCGMVLAPLVTAKAFGIAALAHVSWGGMVLPLAALGLLRGLLGVALAVLWLAPILLAFMVASAWLKRWGAPALVVGTALVALLLRKFYGWTWVGELLATQFSKAREALLGSEMTVSAGGPRESLSAMGQWLVQDTGRALADALSLNFIGGLVLAALLFAALVARRRQG